MNLIKYVLSSGELRAKVTMCNPGGHKEAIGVVWELMEIEGGGEPITSMEIWHSPSGIYLCAPDERMGRVYPFGVDMYIAEGDFIQHFSAPGIPIIPSIPISWLDRLKMRLEGVRVVLD